MFDYNSEKHATACKLKENFTGAATVEDGVAAVSELFDMTRGWEMRREERIRGIEAFLQPSTDVQQRAVGQVRSRLCIQAHL